MRSRVVYLGAALALGMIGVALADGPAAACTSSNTPITFDQLVAQARMIVLARVLAAGLGSSGNGYQLAMEQTLAGPVTTDTFEVGMTDRVADACPFPDGPPTVGDRGVFFFDDIRSLDYPGTAFWPVGADGRLGRLRGYLTVPNVKTLAQLIVAIERALPNTSSSVSASLAAEQGGAGAWAWMCFGLIAGGAAALFDRRRRGGTPFRRAHAAATGS
jgi:hypothetical protein